MVVSIALLVVAQVKAITIRQPWASLIAAGVKTIETRPRRTSYRGRIAIHAGLAKPDSHLFRLYGAGANPIRWELGVMPWEPIPELPLGAMVASAVLTDCAPIGGPYSFRTGAYEGDEGDYPGQAVVVRHPGGYPRPDAGDTLMLSTADTRTVEITDQLPFGDFTPGRWALLLDDIAPTTERCPACWDTDLEPGIVHCVPHRGQPMDEACFACWNGEPCPTCDGATRCDPIPARGQQAVPWGWRP